MSAAGSQARKRGQARVHVVQPFSPWMQLSRPSSSSRWNGLVLALLVLVADDVVRAGDHAAGAAGAQPGGDDLGVELFPLRGPALRLGVGGGGAESVTVMGRTLGRVATGNENGR